MSLKSQKFNSTQIEIINTAVAMSEELVCEFYKMSANQWLRHRYDVKTLAGLLEDEIVEGPFAQLIRFQGRKQDTYLHSSAYDFYKICLQDHTILEALRRIPELQLLPFSLYIVTHELVHIVRFSRFLAHFDASPEERVQEEVRVHSRTHDILALVQVKGLKEAFHYYREWREPKTGEPFLPNLTKLNG